MIDIYKFLSYQDYLNSIYTKKHNKNPSYSHRAFSRDLGISVSTLSNVLNYKKSLGTKGIKNISKNLKLNIKANRYFENMVYSQTETSSEKKIKALSYIYTHGSFWKRDVLKQNDLILLENWYGLVVFCALSIPAVSKNPYLISEVVGVSKKDLSATLDLLEELGLIKRSGNKIVKLKKNIELKSEVPNSSIKKFHIAQLAQAQDMLINQPLEKRNFKNLTISFDSKQKELINNKIDEFISDIEKISTVGKKNSVVTLNLNALYFEDLH